MTSISGIPRFSRMSLPIIALFILLTMTVGMFTSLVFKMENLQRISRGFYSSKAVFFIFTGDAEYYGRFFLDVIDVETESDYLVVNATEDVRGVYLKGTTDTPPLLEGRFMTSEESAASLPLAIIGNDRWNEVAVSGGRRTINLLGQSYEVIGKMGTPYASVINTLVMVNMGSVPQERLAAGRIYIDGKDPEAVFDGIKGNCSGVNIGAPTRLAPQREAIDVVMRRNFVGSTYLVIVLAVMMLSSAILMVEWIRNKIHTIAVFRLVGFSGQQICFRILRSYLTLAIIGIGVALAFMSFLNAANLFEFRTTFIRQAVTMAGLSLLMGLGITVPALLRAVRIDVVRILR